MTQLHAQPYDLSATGFYFESVEEFDAKAKANRNDYGQLVEEYEIQFIDGEAIDCDLAKAIGINQANFGNFLKCADAWEAHEKVNVIIAVGECGYNFDPDESSDQLGIDIYAVDTLRKLAEQFVDEGLYGEIPESLQYYIDFDAIARDLSVEFSEATVAGGRYVYACR
ncbi:antirestriction protein ArdA [Sulfitobacter geojensis]|uniref:antirestriction protein ArdA n=1 Tax=Sulfitobacter geojensis TaxID=1342299 RepID=UPI0004691E30|nr:antirestriction protein ArdA [Sulfitobacter geojensis]KHA51920.1 Antirestriction ArdA family protein [Sulfitobacter geojensis]NYI29327.1 hypothetical protein [Sulfitobacter geojensis]